MEDNNKTDQLNFEAPEIIEANKSQGLSQEKPFQMTRWTISRQLLAMGFGFVFVIVIASSLIFYLLFNLSANFEKLNEDARVEERALGEIERAIGAILSETREYALLGEDETLEEIDEQKELLDRAFAIYAETGEEEEEGIEEVAEEEALEKLNEATAAVLLESNKIISLIDNDVDEDELEEALEEGFEDAENAVEDALAEARKLVEKEVGETALVVDQTIDRMRILFIIGPLVILTLLAAVAFGVRRSVVGRVMDLSATAQEIAAGNLEKEAAVVQHDEIGLLAYSFNTMTASLKEQIAESQTATRNLIEIDEISRRLVSALDFDKFVIEVVQQIKDRFDYYHVQFYVADQADNSLKLAAATGLAGETMLAQNHTIQLGRGLVGRAGEEKEVVLATNLSPIIAPEVVTASNVDTVYQRETNTAARRQWYHKYITETFGTFDDLVADVESSAHRFKLGYILYDVGEFAQPLMQGARDAARLLGVDIEIFAPPHVPKPGQLLKAFDQMLVDGKDGLIVVPQQQSVWPSYFNKAVERGVPVVTANLTGPDIEDWVWFGQDGYQGGFALAVEFRQHLQAAGLNDGEILVGISGTGELEAVARYNGFEAGIAGTSFSCSPLFHTDTLDSEEDYEAWAAQINARPQIVAAVGLTAVSIPTLSRIKTDTEAEWLIAGFDLETATLEALKDNVAQVTVAQHPYLQGYLPVLALVQYLRQGRPLADWVIEDWLPNPLLPDTKSEISVPILVEGQMEGVLDVQASKVDGIGIRDIRVLRSLANQIAFGLRNARQFEQVQQALAQAQAVQEQYVEVAWDKDKVLRQNVGQVRFSMGESRSLTESAVVEARNIAQMQAESVSASLDDGRSDAFIAPIRLRNTTIGNLQLHGLESGNELTENEQAMVEAIVDQVAQAAENLRLISETQERASREQFITQVSDKLRRAPDIESLMNIGVQEIARVLGPSRTFVHLGSEDEFGQDGYQPDEQVEHVEEQLESKPDTDDLDAQPETEAAAPEEEPPVYPSTNGRGDK